ncbi:MAG: tetratricopeptide repeat protein [Crocinitomix sp.]|nr:tetratricopeptide repeat protein [Crocinitomix sp.]
MKNLKTLAVLLIALLTNFALSAQTSLNDLMEKGRSEIGNKDFIAAKSTYKNALEIATQDNDLITKSKIQNNLGVVFWHLEQYKVSIDFYEKAIYTNGLLGNDTLIAESHYNLALSLRKLGNNDLAIKNFLEALRLFEKLNDEKGQAYIYDVLGNIYLDLGDLEKALSYHETSLKIYQKIDYTKGVSRSCHNLAQVYLAKKEVQKAQGYLENEKKLKRELGLSTASNSALYGELYRIKQVPDSAAFYLKHSLEERVEENNYSAIGLAYFHLGDFYYSQNDYESTRIYLDLAYSSADSLGLNQLLIDVINLKIGINRIDGNYRANDQLYSQLIRLNEIVLGETNIREIARFDVEYESMKKDKELLLKRSELDFKIAEVGYLNYENKLLIVIVSIVSLTILLIILFYFSVRKKKEELEEQNQVLGNKNRVIDYLNKEMNHRMVNYFSMFTGMLKIDRKKTNEIKMKELLTDYVNRLHAMSQIQHYLRKENDSASNIVLLDSYVSNLLAEIDVVLNRIGPKIKINESLESVSTSYNIALRIGIAVNELTHNAYKHAFDNVSNPQINVSLKSGAGAILLEVSDNGLGMSSEAKRENAMGIDLIKTLLNSVQGEIEYSENQDKGVKIEIRIRN